MNGVTDYNNLKSRVKMIQETTGLIGVDFYEYYEESIYAVINSSISVRLIYENIVSAK